MLYFWNCGLSQICDQDTCGNAKSVAFLMDGCGLSRILEVGCFRY